MKQEYHTAREIAPKELRDVLATSEALLSALDAEGSDSTKELRDRLTTIVAEVKRELHNSFFATAREKYHAARNTAVSVNQFTQKHPWASVTIGVGIGFLLGTLMSD